MDVIDHLERMKSRLPSHQQGAAQFDKLLQVSAGQYQEIETALHQLLLERSITTAVGEQLDGIGRLVNLARVPGQSDDDYRFALRTYTLVLAKSGDVESVIETFLVVMNAPGAVYTEVYPATFQIAAVPGVDLTNQAVADFIVATMAAAKPAGVNMLLTTLEGFTVSQASEVDVNRNGPTDADAGFGSSVYGEFDGGELSRVV